MNKDKIIEAMGYVDPALVEAADTPRVRRTGWMRSALIAACLCLVLAGTAAAAVRASRIQVTEQFDGRQPLVEYGDETPYSGYSLTGGVEFIPADSLSDEINQMAREHPRDTSYMAIGAWSAAENLVGRSLLSNSVLETAPSGPFYSGGTAKGRCLITIGAGDQGPTAITVTTGYYFSSSTSKESERVKIGLCAELFTDIYADTKKGQSEDEITLESAFFPAGLEITQEDYVTPNGLETIIFHVQSTKYSAYFTLNGVRFNVTASYQTDGDAALEILKNVLDACTL